MEKKQNITQYRERLNKTLASPDLTDEETLKTLVKSQLLRSSEDEAKGCNQKVIERRTAEVSCLLDMLRSTSLNDNKESKASKRSQAEWKLKQDNEEFRVMYREGLEGTPFHTLLVEGYVDGPIDLCLCLSWETSLYSKWWPQFSVPTFKILSCKCLQKVRIGEQISLVRMKVSWPLSTREAVVHYFLFEYFQDDLIVVLLNTISDSENIDIATHGFTNEAIPEAKDVVRIDVVGGFALQKVTSERSYFRTIANMDVKLDFVPPSLINFISRQLIGNGFRLYQKAVASVFKCDKDFIKALGDPLYAKIHEALYSTNVPKGALEEKELKTDECVLLEEHLIERKQDDLMHTNQEVHSNYHVSEYELKNGRVTDRKAFGEIEEEERGAVEGKELKTDECVLTEEHLIEGKQDDLMHTNQEVHSNYHVSEYELKNGGVTDRKAFGEIEEEESEESTDFEEDGQDADHISSEEFGQRCNVSGKRNISISPEVEQALGTLEKVISVAREYGFNARTGFSSGFTSKGPPNMESHLALDSNPSTDERICLSGEVSLEVWRKDNVDRASQEPPRNSSSNLSFRNAGSNSFSREVNHKKIAPASPGQYLSVANSQVALYSSASGTSEVLTLEQSTYETKQASMHGNGIHGIHGRSQNGEGKSSKQKNHLFCFSIRRWLC